MIVEFKSKILATEGFQELVCNANVLIQVRWNIFLKIIFKSMRTRHE